MVEVVEVVEVVAAAVAEGAVEAMVEAMEDAEEVVVTLIAMKAQPAFFLDRRAGRCYYCLPMQRPGRSAAPINNKPYGAYKDLYNKRYEFNIPIPYAEVVHAERSLCSPQ